jgi:hypothetical protein
LQVFCVETATFDEHLAFEVLGDGFFETDLCTEADAPMDCADSQSKNVEERNDTSTLIPSSCGKKVHKEKVIKLKEEQLDLQCEWWGCDYRSCDREQFVCHVSLHIPEREVNDEGTISVVFSTMLVASCST